MADRQKRGPSKLLKHLGDKPDLVVLASLQRAERSGLLVVSGKHGKDYGGATVRLVEEAERTPHSPQPRSIVRSWCRADRAPSAEAEKERQRGAPALLGEKMMMMSAYGANPNPNKWLMTARLSQQSVGN